MIGYVCKYTPIEVLEAMGVETCRIEPSVTNFNQADILMHPNVCSFAKSVLEDVKRKDYEGVVLTTCCDSIRRLYDALREQYPNKFIYLLDLPRKVNDFAVNLYQKRIQEMIEAYERFSGKQFSVEKLKEIVNRKHEEEQVQMRILDRKRQEQTDKETPLRIGLMGARCSKGVLQLLENRHVEILFDITCTGLKRIWDIHARDVLHGYADSLLNQLPCVRMIQATNRRQYVEGFSDRLDGIIYHMVKFCDVYAYEYTQLHKNTDIPILAVETDATRQCEGQIRTRVEAFLEALQLSRGEAVTKARKKKKEGQPMYVLGIDSGSTSTNAVILDENKKIVAASVVRTGAKSGESAQKILAEVLDKAKLKREDIDLIVSTGYGRVSIPFADQNVTEISCHGRGAHYFNPAVRTILDIGGQDSKAIRLNEQGEVIDFVMNDKCAAGTGRFLEMMARTLEIDISELGPISLEWKEDIEISSMCSVFAESEVISLIANNKEKCDIAHGIHQAIAGKAYSLMRRVGLEEAYMMTGGVAKNPGVVRAVEDKIQSKLYICAEPEIVGAVGAALFGMESL